MKRLMCVSALSVILILCMAIACSAAVPALINYQGRLMQPSGTAVVDGLYSLQFTIYDMPVGGTSIWTESIPSVQVKGGLFNVLLGSVTELVPSVFDAPNRYIGVAVDGDAEMTPRQMITSVGYSIKA